MANNVDFTSQITAFRSAVYGREVRQALIDIAEALETACNNQLISVDTSLSTSGAGADAATVGSRLSTITNLANAGYAMSYLDNECGIVARGEMPATIDGTATNPNTLTAPGLWNIPASLAATWNSSYSFPVTTQCSFGIFPVDYYRDPNDLLSIEVYLTGMLQLVWTPSNVYWRAHDYVAGSSGTWSAWRKLYLEVDNTLSVSGAAADAAAVGDEITDLKSALSETARKLRIPVIGPSKATADYFLPMKSGDKLYITNNSSGTITPQLLVMTPYRTMVQNFGNVQSGKSVEVTANTSGTHVSCYVSSAGVAGEEIIIDTIQLSVIAKLDALHQTISDECDVALKTAKISYQQIEEEEEEEEEFYNDRSTTRIDDHTIETNTNYTGFESYPKKPYTSGKGVFLKGHIAFTSASARILAYFKAAQGTGFDNPHYAVLKTITNPNGAGNSYETEFALSYIDSTSAQSGMNFVGVGFQNIQTAGDTNSYRISVTNFYIKVVDADIAEVFASEYYDDNFLAMAKNIFDKLDEEEVITVDYAHVNDGSNDTNHETSHSISGGGTLSGNTATITSTNSGIQTNRIQYKGDDILYRIRAKVTHNAKVCRVLAFGYEAMSGGAWKDYSTLWTSEQNSSYATKEEDIDITFDPANFAVYKGYDIFNICYQLQGLNPETNEATETIADFSIVKQFPYESLVHYDPEFPKLFQKLSTAITNNANAIENISGGSSEAKIVDPNGNKYALRVLSNGSLVAVPHIPSKAIFIGNSFLLGQTFYGMCATDPEYDWYHLTMDAILEKNPSAIAYRCHGAWFEQLGTSGNWQTSWNNQTVRFQMDNESNLGWNDIFDDDIDLVVIQLGDNADGTDDRLTAYNANLDAFCNKITTLCPKARLLFLGSSARYAHTQEVTEVVVEKYGMGLIVIQDLRQYSDFNGVAGQTYLLPDGTRAETPTAWLSHAGNGGHQHIADAVIEWLDM